MKAKAWPVLSLYSEGLVAGANPQHALPSEKGKDSLGAHARNPFSLLFNAYDITGVRKNEHL